MRRSLIATLIFAVALVTLGTMAAAADPPPKMAGLCVRTAPKGYVVLEARLMTSSGDPQLDARAVKEIIGSEVPRPNSRM